MSSRDTPKELDCDDRSSPTGLLIKFVRLGKIAGSWSTTPRARPLILPSGRRRTSPWLSPQQRKRRSQEARSSVLANAGSQCSRCAAW